MRNFFLLLNVFIAVDAFFAPIDSSRFSYDSNSECTENEAFGACENQYYICANRKKFVAYCPDRLIYDRYHHQCTYGEKRFECRHDDLIKELYYSGNETTQERICLTLRSEGHHTFPCENMHYECKYPAIIWHKCPEGLVYNRGSCLEDKCTKKEYNMDCVEDFKEKDPLCRRPSPVITGDLDEEFSCSNKEDGNYKAGRCQNQFYICIDFKRFTSFCPDGLVFSPRAIKSYCQHRRDVKRCPEYKTDQELYNSPNEPSRNNRLAWSSFMFSVGYSECSFKELHEDCPQNFDPNNRKLRVPSRWDCRGTYDQNYPVYQHCSNKYFACNNTTRINGSCTENQVFSRGSLLIPQGRCLYNKHCPGQAMDLALVHARNSSICAKKPDGPYIFQCENEYYECKNGAPIWKSCPEGQVYNRWSCPVGCTEKIYAEECDEYEDIDPRCTDYNSGMGRLFTYH